ncbi:cytochrome P450 [Kibdelosporangium aridum]|uniref:Cytochrome P450 n=1 Tax=Kibdelosporangium aridum TaxID=2030 RepID=A0A1Y5Y5G9_KIBAR|nr:cytochrome P450 [Kibdelosporangium aridum]SMD25335.1 Cytochrome P450 [Kibdelosporangium aridum]
MADLGLPVPETADLDDLMCAEAVDRPSDFYRRMRDVHPVYWNKRWNGWVVTGYAEVLTGFRDHSRLSSDRFAGPFGKDLKTSSDLFSVLSKFFVWKDPPEHTHMRGLVQKAFTPRSIERLRPRIRQLTRSLIPGLRDEPSADFLARFAFTLPLAVIAEYLGVPAEEREVVRNCSQELAAVIFGQRNDPARMSNGERAMHDLVELIRPLVQRRRRDPREDLITGMIHAAGRTEPRSDNDIVAHVIAVLFAGHETTTNLLANGIVAFDQFPGQWRLLGEHPQLARTAPDEILRFDCPVRAQARWAKHPLDLGGRRIAQGDRVLLVQYGANRDPAFFEHPDHVDITRSPNRHLAFGHGIHTCLGAALARVEAEIAFEELARTFPEYTVDHELHYQPTVTSRSLSRLHVTFHEA